MCFLHNHCFTKFAVYSMVVTRNLNTWKFLIEHSLVWSFCLMSTILILFIDNLPPPTRTVVKALLFPASQVYRPVSSLWTFFRIRIDPVRMFNPLFTIIEPSLYQWMARSWLFGFTTQFMLIFLLMSLT